VAVYAAQVPSLRDFAELQQTVPPFVALNLVDPTRMKYRVPTPIQKHTVPLVGALHPSTSMTT
jgi:hypothetical protein